MSPNSQLPPAEIVPPPNAEGLSPEEFQEIDAILDDLRTRSDETPQWEFCDGFMAALIACRRPIPPEEYFGALLDLADGAGFADAAQEARFHALWQRRWQESVTALDAKVESLEDDATYYPSVVDMRGILASLPEAERPQVEDGEVPSYGQIWAIGFMYAVETWPEEWEPPRDKQAQALLNEALDTIVALTEDDTDPPEISMLEEGGAPSVSKSRMEAFAAAIWGVYDLRALWRSMGPRQDPVRRSDTPGRNDLCPCGSGKKYKKCCGA